MLSGLQKNSIRDVREQIYKKECDWMKKVREITRLLKELKIHQQKLEPLTWSHESDWIPQIEETMRKQKTLLESNDNKNKLETEISLLRTHLENFFEYNHIDINSPYLSEDEYELVHGIYFDQV